MEVPARAPPLAVVPHLARPHLPRPCPRRMRAQERVLPTPLEVLPPLRQHRLPRGRVAVAVAEDEERDDRVGARGELPGGHERDGVALAGVPRAARVIGPAREEGEALREPELVLGPGPFLAQPRLPAQPLAARELELLGGVGAGDGGEDEALELPGPAGQQPGLALDRHPGHLRQRPAVLRRGDLDVEHVLGAPLEVVLGAGKLQGAAPEPPPRALHLQRHRRVRARPSIHRRVRRHPVPRHALRRVPGLGLPGPRLGHGHLPAGCPPRFTGAVRLALWPSV